MQACLGSSKISLYSFAPGLPPTAKHHLPQAPSAAKHFHYCELPPTAKPSPQEVSSIDSVRLPSMNYQCTAPKSLSIYVAECRSGFSRKDFKIFIIFLLFIYATVWLWLTCVLQLDERAWASEKKATKQSHCRCPVEFVFWDFIHIIT